MKKVIKVIGFVVLTVIILYGVMWTVAKIFYPAPEHLEGVVE